MKKNKVFLSGSLTSLNRTKITTFDSIFGKQSEIFLSNDISFDKFNQKPSIASAKLIGNYDNE